VVLNALDTTWMFYRCNSTVTAFCNLVSNLVYVCFCCKVRNTHKTFCTLYTVFITITLEFERQAGLGLVLFLFTFPCEMC